MRFSSFSLRYNIGCHLVASKRISIDLHPARTGCHCTHYWWIDIVICWGCVLLIISVCLVYVDSLNKI